MNASRYKYTCNTHPKPNVNTNSIHQQEEEEEFERKELKQKNNNNKNWNRKDDSACSLFSYIWLTNKYSKIVHDVSVTTVANELDSLACKNTF